MELNLVTKEDLEAMEIRIIKKLVELVKPSKKKKMSVEEACERLGGMKKKTLLYKAGIGEIASYKVGKHLVFDEDGIEEYLAKVRRMSNDELARRVWK